MIVPKKIILQIMKQVLDEYNVELGHSGFVLTRLEDIPDEVDTKRSAHWVSISNPINYTLRGYEDIRRSYSGQEFTDKIMKRAEALALGVDEEHLGVLDI